MKEGLRWLNEMYTEGLISQEWSTVDTYTALEDYVATNRCGIFFGPHWYGFSLQSYEDTMDEGADWIEAGLPVGSNGLSIQIPANNTVDGWICVNKNCENPEAVVHMLNAYVEQLFGENQHFADYFACELDSSLWKATPVWCLSATVDLDPCANMAENYDAETGTMNEEGLVGAGLTYWEYIKSGMSAYQYMFGPVDSCFCYVAETYPDDLLWNAYLGSPTDTQNERWSSMTELIDISYFYKIFKSYYGMTPKEYREQKRKHPFAFFLTIIQDCMDIPSPKKLDQFTGSFPSDCRIRRPVTIII